ncbi:Neprilysin-2 [Nymphon striatum]|nr:Neprilysin-2 [Nymphon striatum]
MPSTSATYRVQIQDAYQQWKSIYGEEKQLPGLEYNSNQMFWISYGSVSCAEYTKDFIHHLNKNDEHSLDEARVNIPLRNSPSFAKDFHCHSGSRMNPKQKCNVW